MYVTRQWPSFSFPELWYSPLDNIWQIEQDRINAMKFEAAQTHFLTDIFVAVAITVT